MVNTLHQKTIQYFFAPRFRLNRFEFNLIALALISLGLLLGFYMAVTNFIPKIFATSQASITTDTDADFNAGTLASTTVSGAGSSAVIELSGGGGPSGTVYYKSVTIDNSSGGVLSNYPVKVTVDTASLISANKLQSNCADIRFTDSDQSTLLSYYIASGCNTSSTTIWVKIPTISASSSKTVYFYYDSSSASAGSNFDDTFSLPSSISGLKLWLKADAITGVSNGGTVSSWSDQSGNGYDATQSITGDQALYETNVLNGKPVLRFNGTSDWYSMASGLTFALNSYTSFIVHTPQSSTAYGMIMASNNGNSDYEMLDMNYPSHGLLGTYMAGPGNVGGSYSFSAGTSYISSFVSSSTGIPYTDGVAQTSGTTATQTVGNLHLGTYTGGNYLWNGDMAEIIIFNTALSGVNRQIIEEYLSAKYDIAITYAGPAISLGSETSSIASSGTWESASNNNVIDTFWNGGWGDGSSDSSTAFSATVGSVSSSQTIAFQMRVAGSKSLLTSASYVTLGTVNSGTTFTQTKKQLDDLGLSTGNNRYIQVKVTFSQNTGTSPTLDKFTIFYAKDNTNPETNATSPLMYTSNGGRSISSSGWDDSSTPYFSWTAGSDSQSGIKGYCLYLGTSNSANPTTSSPGDLNASNSPVSASGTDCDGGDGFIVSSSSVDLSTAGYIGTNLTSSDSSYYLGVAAVDNAGNVASSFTFFPFYYDGTVPTNVAYTSCSSGNFSNVTDMNFSWPTSGSSASSDSDSGLLGWQYQINSSTGNWQGTTHDATLDLDYIPATASAYTLVSSRDSSVITTGANVIYFRTLDNAGNTSSGSTYRTCSLSYGGAAPTFPGNGTVSITPQTSTTNSFALSWPDATATDGQKVTHYYYMINNSPPSSLTTLQSNSGKYVDNGTSTSVSAGALANISKGTNIVYVVAIDDASTPDYSSSNGIEGTFTLNSTDPDPVQNLVATDSSIKDQSQWNTTLTWTAPVYQGAGNLTYNIYRSTDDATFSKVGSTVGLSYVDNAPSSTKYYYYIATEDGANATSSNSTTVAITPTGKYTSAPNLQSGPTTEGITTQAVTITWSTDRSSDSKVAYGTTADDYNTTEPYVSTQVTSHAVTINNLTPGTTYYYKVFWTDADGNTGSSTEETFSTSPPPTVSSVAVSNISLSSALVTFTTNNANFASVLYGLSTSYGGVANVETGASQSTYSVPLTGLQDGTVYHFEIQLKDENGSIYTFEDHQFITLPRPKIGSIQIAQVAGTAQPTVLVSWTTNTDISSIITYYPVGNVGQAKDNVDVALIHGSHQMLISGLDPKTSYQMIVKGRDKVGNEAVSDTQTFTTATDTRPPYISNLGIQGSSVSSAGSSSQPQVSQLVVTWDTDKAATSQVEYGEGTGNTYSQKTQQDSNLTFNHLVIISGLSPSKVYHLKALSVDKYTNTGQSIDTVTITPKSTDNALNLVISNLEQAFGFLGALNGGGQ